MQRFEVKPYSPWLWLALPAWCLIFLIFFPPHNLDLAFSHLFFNGGVFVYKNNDWLRFLYKASKFVSASVTLIAIFFILRSFIGRKSDETSTKANTVRAFYVLIALSVCGIVVWWLKSTTGVFCPWSLNTFGKSAPLTDPNWSWVFQEGHCWPAGHASVGFCLFALFFAFRDSHAKLAYKLLAGAFIVGLICSAIRIIQGAHFLSHTIATALIDWLICAVIYIIVFDHEKFLIRLKTLPRKVQFNHFMFRTALFWTLCFNTPFLSAIIKTAGTDSENILSTAVLLLAVFAGVFFLCISLIALLGLLPRILFKICMVLLTFLGVTSLVAWLYYGVAMTPDMIRNFLATDFQEASGYWSWRLPLTFILFSLPGLIFIASLRPSRRKESYLKRGAICLISLLCGLFALFSQLQPFSALMRGDKSIRYLIAPVNIVYSTGSTLFKDDSPGSVKKRLVDANPITLNRPNNASLIVVVIGETARSANWQLAGYDKATNPLLSKLNIVNIPKVTACGTSTDVSLPCMLSRVGRRQYDRERILSEEALPSLLKRAGWNVTWIENQSGCKGTCEGVTVIEPQPDSRYCEGKKCMDGIFIRSVSDSLQKIKNGEQAVLFLHMMGSHGPAYYKRSTADEKVFGPECEDPTFKSCTNKSIQAAYDSSIRYTDRVLADLIVTLKARQDLNTALIYVSDHGESLGEKGLYLHGAPYYIAPDEQKEVPMLMWFSEKFKKNFALNSKVLEENAKQTVTHDHLYHTILGLLNVQSSTYEKKWDLSAG